MTVESTNEQAEWSVLVEFTIGSDEPMEAWGDDVFDLLEDHAASISAGTGRAAARLSVEVDDPVHASQVAVELVGVAFAKCGLDPRRVVLLQVDDAADLDRRNAEPTIPVLIGVAELAGILGVTKQRASALARSTGFPLPIAELASGPIWAEPMVRRFVDEWARRPGRPPSNGG